VVVQDCAVQSLHRRIGLPAAMSRVGHLGRHRCTMMLRPSKHPVRCPGERVVAFPAPSPTSPLQRLHPPRVWPEGDRYSVHGECFSPSSHRERVHLPCHAMRSRTGGVGLVRRAVRALGAMMQHAARTVRGSGRSAGCNLRFAVGNLQSVAAAVAGAGQTARTEAGRRSRIVGSYGNGTRITTESRASRVQKWPASRLLCCADQTTCQHGQRKRRGVLSGRGGRCW
jgi:hypothetical protein